MAKERTLYTRTYTYLGQTSWTRNSRSVNWSAFEASGDTDKEIVEIVSVNYVHYNNSYDYSTYQIRGGLYLSNGTVIYSDTVTKKHSANTAYLYTNTFTTLPTPAQFNMISAVRTYAYDVDEAEDYGYAGGSSQPVTWRADSKYPMRIVVTFYNEEPYLYDPVIEQFKVTRASKNASGTYVADDAGTYARITASGSDTGVSTSYASIMITATNGVTTRSYSSPITRAQLVAGVSNYVFTTDTFSADYDWKFTLYFTYTDSTQSPAYVESTSRTSTMSNSMVALHISSAKKGGVSFGDLSTATDNNPKFEVHHPAYLYGGIAQIGSSSSDLLSVLGIQVGSVSPVSIDYATLLSGTVTFSKAFSSVPTILTAMTTNSSKTGITNYWAGEVNIYVYNVTTTGFSYTIVNGRSVDKTLGFDWAAIGGPSSGSSSGGSTESGGDDGSGGDSSDTGDTNSTVSASANYSSGLHVATIIVDDTPTQIFVPTATSTSASSTSALATAYMASQFLKTLSFSAGVLTGTAGNSGTSTATIYSYGDSLPSTGTNGQLFFLL